MTETYEEVTRRLDKEFRTTKKYISFEGIGGKGSLKFEREKWTFMPQFNLKEKFFVVERLKLIELIGSPHHAKNHKIGEIEYRVGYWIVGKKGNRKGVWTWGQFCPLIPEEDLKRLLKQAESDGVF